MGRIQDLYALYTGHAPTHLAHVAQEEPHLFHRRVYVERYGPLRHRASITERTK